MKNGLLAITFSLIASMMALAEDTTALPQADVSDIPERPPQQSIMTPTIAVLPFEGRGRQAENTSIGKSVSELVFVSLLENGFTNLVERAELDKALDELHLSATGMTSPDSQLQLGRIIGAKILVMGSLFDIGEKKYLVAKIVGTETSLVRGCSASGTGDYTDMVPELAAKICSILDSDVERLLPRAATVFSAADRLASIQGQGRKIYLNATAKTAAGKREPSSSAVLQNLLLVLGFQITPVRGEADFAIECDVACSSAGQYQKFTSASAHVEIKVFEGKENRLLASGSQKETLANASYPMAEKDAIEQATLKLAGTLLNCLK